MFVQYLYRQPFNCNSLLIRYADDLYMYIGHCHSWALSGRGSAHVGKRKMKRKVPYLPSI